MQGLKGRLFDKIEVYYIALLLCLVFRVLFAINNPVLSSDYSIQYEAAKNYEMTGHFVNSQVASSNLNLVIEKPLGLWPVGFSMVALFLNLFMGNMIYTAIFIQALAAILLITGILKVMQTLQLSRRTQTLFLILFAVNNSIFYYAGSSDLFTAGLFVWTVFLVLASINQNKFNVGLIIVISFLSFLSAAMRMACIPNLAIIPLFYAILFILKKEKKFLWYSLLIGLIGVSFTFLFYQGFPIDSSRTSFVENLKSGNLYFSGLKWFDPFPIKAFFFTRPFEYRLPNNSQLLFFYRSTIMLASIGFTIFLFSGVILKLKFRKWLKDLFSKKWRLHDSFLLILFCASTVIVSFITLQTLTSAPEFNSFGPTWMPPYWTFVYSTRYFIFVMTLLIILFFVGYDQNTVPLFKKRFFNIIYIVSFLFALGYGVFMNYQFYSPKGNGAGSEWINKKELIFAYDKMNSIYKTENKPHIVYSHFNYKSNEGLITGYSFSHTCNEYTNIVGNKFYYAKPLVLILAMPLHLNEKEQLFLKRHSFSILGVSESEQIIRINLS